MTQTHVMRFWIIYYDDLVCPEFNGEHWGNVQFRAKNLINNNQ